MIDQANPGQVLVVDDQEGIRQLIRRILTRQGYLVIDAEDGPGAIALCTTISSINAAIIDLTMPAMDGITLTKKLREVRPLLPIVLMSGFDMDDVLASQPQIEPAPSYLEKPFKIHELLAAIESAKLSIEPPPTLPTGPL